MTAWMIAKRFIELSYSGDEPDPLTPLRLQKLLYYAQGWSVGLRQVQLFPEELEAWQYGPVLRPIYYHFAPLGKGVIPEEALPDTSELDAETKAFVDGIWESYKSYSAIELSRKTHEEDPWRNCYKQGQKQIISIQELITYFGKKIEAPLPIQQFQQKQLQREQEASEKRTTLPILDKQTLRERAKTQQPPVEWYNEDY